MTVPTGQEVLQAAAAHHGVPVSRILVMSSNFLSVRMRASTALALRELGYTYEDCGRTMKRHHSSIIDLVRRYRDAPLVQAAAAEIARLARATAALREVKSEARVRELEEEVARLRAELAARDGGG